jgi:hypothetical protein
MVYLWGRRSYFVACLGASKWQATQNDGLPHSLILGCLLNMIYHKDSHRAFG